MEPRNQLLAVRETSHVVERMIKLMSRVGDLGDDRLRWIDIQRLGCLHESRLRHELDFASCFAAAHDVGSALVLSLGDKLVRQAKIHDMISRSSSYSSGRGT